MLGLPRVEGAGNVSNAYEEAALAASSREVSTLRRAWDHLPSIVRRPILWSMRSDWLRLKVLGRLGIRDESAFFPLSNGGARALDAAIDVLKKNGPRGDYFEFGIYRGYTLWYAQRAARRAGLSDMRFYGFDSFEGLPEIEGNDRKAALFISGDYRCTLPEVERLLTLHGYDLDRGRLVPGYFDKSLTPALKSGEGMEKAALVMVDCDLYQSTVPCLAFIADLLQDGTVMLFDDWYCFGKAKDRGEPRAFNEFLAEHQQWWAEPFMKFGGYGQGFIMKRQAAPSPSE